MVGAAITDADPDEAAANWADVANTLRATKTSFYGLAETIEKQSLVRDNRYTPEDDKFLRLFQVVVRHAVLSLLTLADVNMTEDPPHLKAGKCRAAGDMIYEAGLPADELGLHVVESRDWQESNP
jgi:hypothetical protein